MVKYKVHTSGKHTFVDVKGKYLDVFRVFKTQKEAKNYLTKLKTSKYWK